MCKQVINIIHNIFNHYRTLSFIKKYYNGKIPKFEAGGEVEQMIAQVSKELKVFIELMECIKYTITVMLSQYLQIFDI